MKTEAHTQKLKHMYPSDVLMQSLASYLFVAVFLYYASQFIFQSSPVHFMHEHLSFRG